MNQIYLYLYILLFFSCNHIVSDIDLNKDIKYPPKIDVLQHNIGIEKVKLFWEISNINRVEGIVIEIEETNDKLLLDRKDKSIVIDGLDSGFGYNFLIYTIDRFNNKSLKKNIHVNPISQIQIDQILELHNYPTPDIIINNNTLFVNINDIDNSSLYYLGSSNYVLLHQNTLVDSTKEIDDNTNYYFDNPNPGYYTLLYDLRYVPIIDNQLLIDTLYVRDSVNFNIEMLNDGSLILN